MTCKKYLRYLKVDIKCHSLLARLTLEGITARCQKKVLYILWDTIHLFKHAKMCPTID